MNAQEYEIRNKERQITGIELKREIARLDLEQMDDNIDILRQQLIQLKNPPVLSKDFKPTPKKDGSGQGTRANAGQNPDCPEEKK